VNQRSDRYSENWAFNAARKGRGAPIQIRKMAQYQFTGTGVPTLALPFNPKRTYLIVQNLSAATNLYLGFGAGATASNGILILPNGGNFLADYAVPMDDIYLFFAAGAAETAVICEGVLQPLI
jgi:hypothetical protein